MSDSATDPCHNPLWPVSGSARVGLGLLVGLVLLATVLWWQQRLFAVLGFLEPWEPSPMVLALWGLAVILYALGLRRGARQGCDEGIARPVAFLLGLALTYLALQSRWDYYAQHMFWIHRLQHLVLHHLAPLLLVLAAPAPVLARGLPAPLRAPLRRWAANPVLNALYRGLQQPAVAALLFVGLIYFWLVPGWHYEAMLSAPLYTAMNWSMFVDGLLFWMVMLDPHPRHRLRPAYGVRVLILWLIMIPQIVLGAYITLTNTDLYEVYAVCGRAWATDPLFDQRIGGLIIWIPASMMSVIAAVIVLRMWRRDARRAQQDQV